MRTSKRIAGLVGPSLIAIALSEALNGHLLITENDPNLVHVVYLNGTLLFVAGLAVVRAHNHWTSSWSVLVTLTGWFAVLGGLIRMFAPTAAQQSVQHPTAVYAVLIVCLVIGIFLTFKAYGPGETRTFLKAEK